MESIIAMALEYTLKYWLRSFSRDQFKLQGRTGQLSNLDINGEALHASLGLPPALHVTTARVGKLEITLPSVSNVQVEPFLVQIDRLDLVLEEKEESHELKSPISSQASVPASKGSGYGFADKIADGMTVEVGIVNLLLETRGARRQAADATWSPPIAAITIRNLILYTTNENWQVVNLKEARDFSTNRGCIYVFKKLEWRSLSIDLLPHPDMFTDARFNSSRGEHKRDDDGAKRMFFGGEKFLDGISGEANITVQRTELNKPLGLEVQLHITEAVSPALSEPGLRAFLRFMTGLDVCLNRGDVAPKAQQNAESAGSSIVSILVDHIFLCIKDAEFQLELLMQSLFFSRASLSVGDSTKNLTNIKVGGLFLRDTFSHPPCTLVQPSAQAVSPEPFPVPKFGQNFCLPIYPFGNQLLEYIASVPLFNLYSLQINPAPSPPKLASQTVINLQPIMVTLQEKSCLRISSFLADRVVVNQGASSPDSTVNSVAFALKECDLFVPLDAEEIAKCIGNQNNSLQPSLVGARLQIKELFARQSPSAKCKLLNLEKDPACFSLWEYQSIDASQRKWEAQLSSLSLLLEAYSETNKIKNTSNLPESLWKCVELHELRIDAAMVTADGSPISELPPPEGVVRIGLACERYVSNTSVEQLFFVLALYNYFGQVGDRISRVRKGKKETETVKLSSERETKKLPSDTAISLSVNNLELNFLDSFSKEHQSTILVQYGGEGMLLKVSHRILGGAFAVSTKLLWKAVYVNCLDDGALTRGNGFRPSIEHSQLLPSSRSPKMRAVFWVDNQNKSQANTAQFLDIDITHVMPFNMQDTECHSLHVSAKICGVRLGGGMGYTESLLHRFGVLGPDGGPGEELLKGLNDLSNGPLAKLFKTSAISKKHDEQTKQGDLDIKFDIGMPDDLDVSVELQNWLFALESVEQVDSVSFPCNGDISREERCWHTTFRNLHISGKSTDAPHSTNMSRKKSFPVEFLTVGVDGLQAIKPRLGVSATQCESNKLGTSTVEDGVDVESTLVVSSDDDTVKWAVENIKFAVKQPIEAIATKEEVEHLLELCRSEIDSMGRIAAGILRLLKLDKSLGQAAVEQLSNLGSGGLDRIFSPTKHSRHNSSEGGNLTPKSPVLNSMVDGQKGSSLELVVASLEDEIAESQLKCSALISELSHSGDPRQVDTITQLNQKLNGMQLLVTRMRTLM